MLSCFYFLLKALQPYSVRRSPLVFPLPIPSAFLSATAQFKIELYLECCLRQSQFLSIIPLWTQTHKAFWVFCPESHAVPGSLLGPPCLVSQVLALASLLKAFPGILPYSIPHHHMQCSFWSFPKFRWLLKAAGSPSGHLWVVGFQHCCLWLAMLDKYNFRNYLS